MEDISSKAKEVYEINFEPVTWFERAIFLGWYCSLGDCEFCYMSTKKVKPTAVRSFESVVAEVLVCIAQGWKIDFLTSGHEGITFERLLDLVKIVSSIYRDEIWVNVGYLNPEQLSQLKPYIVGVNGAVECVNPKIRKSVCPSKSMGDIEKMFGFCDEIGLKKAITIIIGLGETEADMHLLKHFIDNFKINRVNFYALNPHIGTRFTKGPESEYYVSWVAYTRVHFPKLILVTGIWTDRVEEVYKLLMAGANAITKFPAIRKFAGKEAIVIENMAKRAGRTFQGSLTHYQKINISKSVLKYSLLNLGKDIVNLDRDQIEQKFCEYLKFTI